MRTDPCVPQHLPGVLHHRGGELPGAGGGSAGGGATEDNVVLLVEGAAPAGPVLHAGKHLLERFSLLESQPQHQGGVSGRKWTGPRLEVRKMLGTHQEINTHAFLLSHQFQL